ncbi:lipocalin-like domain-containing protein [Vibrio diazotrophicus]|uniref:lipocalin-like domain-containing protein n=1 Tax=Vibrio diazotrophicus TaxID=685 RepID=UPI00142DA633|nr:lipocalin-like domain-containing protein [Vibrio diazotrophicus]NIY93819.1 carotenoid 1,2-hydratase [Vibrio diazotrophicus]
MKVRVSLKYLIGLLIFASVVSVTSIVYHDYQFEDEVEPNNEIRALLSSDTKHAFLPVLPNNPVALPKDSPFHPDYQQEWFHYFANVRDKQGHSYSVQWSFFRIAHDERLEELGWLNSQVYFSSAVISSNRKVWREQRVARGGIGQAGVNALPLRMWIDDWAWRALGRNPFPGHLDVKTDTFSLSLYSDLSGPYVLPGDKGFQRKHETEPTATYNLEAPFIKVYGQLKLTKDTDPIAVEGSAFMSKEWGSGLMSNKQQGWDKFVLKLDEDTTLSVNRYRHEEELPYLFGTLSSKEKTIVLQNKDIAILPLNKTVIEGGRVLPLEWRILVPRYNIDLKTAPVNKQSWLPFVVPYWEGAIKTTGTDIAQGYMQLTGY